MTDEATNESRRVWDALAPGYEKHRAYMNELERPVNERMMNGVAARDGDTILELTAGPGGLGLVLAQLRPEVRVLVTDFAPHMVEAAANAAKAWGLGNVQCRLIDAQAIDLPDSSVDGVLSRYGLMLVPDIARAFSEIRRVLKPGRTLTYVVWGPLEANPWMMLFGATLMQRGHFTPAAGGFFPLTTEDENRATVSAAGFDEIQVETVDTPFVHESFERYWSLSSEISGPLAEIVQSLPNEERNAVRDQLEEYTAPFKTDVGLRFPVGRILVRAS